MGFQQFKVKHSSIEMHHKSSSKTTYMHALKITIVNSVHFVRVILKLLLVLRCTAEMRSMYLLIFCLWVYWVAKMKRKPEYFGSGCNYIRGVLNKGYRGEDRFFTPKSIDIFWVERIFSRGLQMYRFVPKICIPMV